MHSLLVFPKLDRCERKTFRGVTGGKSSPPVLRIASDVNSSVTTSGTLEVDGNESCFNCEVDFAVDVQKYYPFERALSIATFLS